MIKNIIVLACFLFAGIKIHAQEFRIENNRDSILFYLNQTTSTLYPDAGVEVFYEIGTVENLPAGSGISYKYEIAFKVYNKEAVGNLLDIVIPKSRTGMVRKVSGTTFNLDNGNIHETKLDKSDVLLDDYSDDLDVVKFSIPGVKNGSIVCYQYTCIKGPFVTNWNFQREDIPVGFSQFNFHLSSFSLITPQVSSSVEFKSFDSQKRFEKSKDKAASLNVLQEFGDLRLRSWKMKNIPPYIKEPLSGNKSQHLEKVNVFYNGMSGGGYHYPIVESWDLFNQKAWYNGALKQAFERYKNLDNIGANEIKDLKDSLEIAKKLYYLVQKNIQKSGKSVDVKDLWNVKQGNSISTAMFMCALYKNKGFYSDLVLLANKGSEKLNPILFNVSDITNCVVRVVIDKVAYLIDPTEKDYPFAYLPTYYYNGYARIVNVSGGEMDITPTLAQNRTFSNVSIKPVTDKDGEFKVTINNKLGVYSALGVRAAWKEDSLAFKKKFLDHAADVSKTLGFSINNVALENFDNLEERLTLVLDGKVNFGKETDMIIYDPYFYKSFSENPLKEVNRKYPVEFDYITRDYFVLQFDLGDQYEVEELPQSRAINFGDPALIRFAQNVGHDTKNNSVKLSYKYDNDATFVSIEDAKDLKDYFAEVLKNFNQKLIIKKKEK